MTVHGRNWHFARYTVSCTLYEFVVHGARACARGQPWRAVEPTAGALTGSIVALDHVGDPPGLAGGALDASG